MPDFLSAEDDILGGFGSSTGGGNGGGDFDFDRAASAFPDISIDGEGDVPPMPHSNSFGGGNNGSGFSFDDFGEREAREVTVTGDEEIEKFEDQFPELDDGAAGAQSFSPPPIPQSQTPFAPRPQFSSTPILNMPVEEDEPEVIKQWRETQAADIRARDEASKAKRQETISRAERAIDAFYENYAEKKEKNIRENKDEESEYVASLSAGLTKGTTWSRICDTIELQNSQSKTIARTGAGTTDLTRFKEVLLRLMREGDAAPGAAGY
ncbi:clathrin light chain [Hygrophoropsis aurantiaca]|uniref:Clathrin light chain n=1 Tax=Hygrophoropsis aurantiaca TaxID=72124 RepID=A0ACB8A4T3_9AGAM|nr:clathrin light chain [Hygrophoropsis aurantiaca]